MSNVRGHLILAPATGRTLAINRLTDKSSYVNYVRSLLLFECGAFRQDFWRQGQLGCAVPFQNPAP